jgi:hypothetical protein
LNVKALVIAPYFFYFVVPIFMKTGHAKSVTLGHPKSVTLMKGNNKPAPYFSRYPLKAIKSASSSNHDTTKIAATRIISRLRVLPMVNPYPARLISINKIKLHDNVQPTDENWFGSYE